MASFIWASFRVRIIICLVFVFIIKSGIVPHVQQLQWSSAAITFFWWTSLHKKSSPQFHFHFQFTLLAPLTSGDPNQSSVSLGEPHQRSVPSGNPHRPIIYWWPSPFLSLSLPVETCNEHHQPQRVFTLFHFLSAIAGAKLLPKMR